MGEFSSILAAESKPVLLAACQANPSRDKLLEQGQMTLFRSQKTERMVDKNSKELSSRVRVQASFILKVKVLVAQSYPIVCHPMDCSPPVRSVHRILQARILECFAIPFSRGSSQPKDQSWVSHTVGRFFTIKAKRSRQSPGSGQTLEGIC